MKKVKFLIIFLIPLFLFGCSGSSSSGSGEENPTSSIDEITDFSLTEGFQYFERITSQDVVTRLLGELSFDSTYYTYELLEYSEDNVYMSDDVFMTFENASTGVYEYDDELSSEAFFQLPMEDGDEWSADGVDYEVQGFTTYSDGEDTYDVAVVAASLGDASFVYYLNSTEFIVRRDYYVSDVLQYSDSLVASFNDLEDVTYNITYSTLIPGQTSPFELDIFDDSLNYEFSFSFPYLTDDVEIEIDSVVTTSYSSGEISGDTSFDLTWTSGVLFGEVTMYFDFEILDRSKLLSSYSGDFTVSPNVYLTYGDVFYIDANATGYNNGSSWEDALTSFDGVYTIANSYGVETAWVAAGTYSSNWEISDNLAVYGGFLSGDTDSSQSDWENNHTIFESLGLEATNVSSITLRGMYFENFPLLIWADTVVIKDVVVQDSEFSEAGLSIYGADVDIENVYFLNNVTDRHIIRIEDSTGLVYDLTVSGNSLSGDTAFGFAEDDTALVYIESSDLSLSNTEYVSNTSYGYPLAIYEASTLALEEMNVVNNLGYWSEYESLILLLGSDVVDTWSNYVTHISLAEEVLFEVDAFSTLTIGSSTITTYSGVWSEALQSDGDVITSSVTLDGHTGTSSD